MTTPPVLVLPLRYGEADPPDPADTYGATKLLGEVTGPGCLTLRTTFFGALPTGAGLLNWLAGQGGGRVEGYAGYRFSGLSTACLAAAIEDLLRRPHRITGLRHVGGEAITKFDLLSAVRDALQLPTEITPQPLPVVDRTLDSRRFWGELGQPVPTLAAMLPGVVAELRAQTRPKSPEAPAAPITLPHPTGMPGATPVQP
ncbi:MAG: hypothetical protein AAF790_13425 [Planctomycetota bacterium]